MILKSKNKNFISIKNIDVNKTVGSNNVSFGKKCFIGYKDAKKIRSLCIFLPKISAYKKDFGETKCMSVLIKDDELLEKYNEIWEKVSKSIKKEFDSEPLYNEKYLKTKIKAYKGKINTNFHNNKIPKEDSQCICLSVILIDSVFRTGNNYHPQVFLKEYKYVVKEKKMLKYITDDIEISSYSNREDSSEESSDEESFDEENCDEENQI